MADRSVIIHYHMFKNAGSSVDAILQHNFGDKWAEIEGPDNKRLTPEGMVDYIVSNPDIKAISSHTAQVTLPKIPGVKILPIFFFRHPIDRIQSAYNFERKQESDTPGSIKAKELDFPEYMVWRLSGSTMTSIVNFHAYRLKDFKQQTYNREGQYLRPRALQAIKQLPLVGLVERFDESMEKFNALIKPHMPEFELITARANTNSNPDATVRSKLKTFEEKIGRPTFTNLMQLNAIDLELYYFVKDTLWK